VTRALLGLSLLAANGCIDRATIQRGAERLGATRTPDVVPVVANEESPFRYPPALWAQRLQGNVTLRLYVDTLGRPVPDSTRVAVSSGMSLFDSAAVAGARNLRFRPAQLRGSHVGVTLLLPVFFRHPEAPPLPGDSVLSHIKPPPRQ
jgi:TonB family protein